jgi:antitoxin (DNA-binding transcriptional repressor) of toxin-antitoxin stability system
MATVTVEEAASSLGRILDRALGGEQILIRKGDAVVELHPALPTAAETLPPRDALRRLQADAHLSPAEAEQYLREASEERKSL